MSKRIWILGACLAALAAAGCQSSPFSKDARVAELERKLAAEKSRSKELKAQIKEAGLADAAPAALAEAAPPEAKPGQCFARVLTPPETRIVSAQVVDRAESAVTKIIPPVYETLEERVLVKEQAVKYEVIPATYKTVVEQVMVQPAYEDKRVVPAKYETYTEKIMVQPAYVTWKPGKGVFGRETASADAAGVAGEVLCRVEEPAKYETVSRQRLVTPEQVETFAVPAKFETIKKTVIDKPAQVVETVTPAVYETRKVKKLVAPAREEKLVAPASVKTKEAVEIVGPGRLEWREVLCETNATKDMIAKVQKALADKGHSPGKIDGVFGPKTLAAMESYQKKAGLGVGQLTRETVESLGLTFATQA